MSDELRELLDQHAIYREGLYSELLSWHIRERKKWAKEKVPKEKEMSSYLGQSDEVDIWRKGYNQCREEILKKIEESR